MKQTALRILDAQQIFSTLNIHCDNTDTFNDFFTDNILRLNMSLC